MPRRRRDDGWDKTEATVKLVFALIILLALGGGGIGGFAQAFASLVFLGVVIALVGVVCFFVMRSPLMLLKRIGISLIFVSGLTLWLWRSLQPPPTWPEARATVRSVVSPPCRTQSDYGFSTQGRALKFTLHKDWPSVDQARRGSAAAITVYFNPSNPTEVNEKPINGWTRVSAAPQAIRYELQGDYRATIAIGRDISTTTATITGAAANAKVGATIPIWINPLNQQELSLVPRDTVGGKTYPMLVLAIMGAVAGVGLLLTNRQWIAPVPAMPTSSPSVGPSDPSPSAWSVATIRAALDEIDWYQFEKFCAALLRADGFEVERKGGAQPDGGVDLIVEKSGGRALIQCKHWRTWVVQEKVIREMLGSMTHFKVTQGAIYTLKGWTEPASRFAAEHDITLVNGDELAQSAATQLSQERLEELLRPREHHCPKCESPMVWRTGNFTSFWGCSRYPACRGKFNHTGAR